MNIDDFLKKRCQAGRVGGLEIDLSPQRHYEVLSVRRSW